MTAPAFCRQDRPTESTPSKQNAAGVTAWASCGRTSCRVLRTRPADRPPLYCVGASSGPDGRHVGAGYVCRGPSGRACPGSRGLLRNPRASGRNAVGGSRPSRSPGRAAGERHAACFAHGPPIALRSVALAAPRARVALTQVRATSAGDPPGPHVPGSRGLLRNPRASGRIACRGSRPSRSPGRIQQVGRERPAATDDAIASCWLWPGRGSQPRSRIRESACRRARLAMAVPPPRRRRRADCVRPYTWVR